MLSICVFFWAFWMKVQLSISTNGLPFIGLCEEEPCFPAKSPPGPLPSPQIPAAFMDLQHTPRSLSQIYCAAVLHELRVTLRYLQQIP